jgi:hypothetical protein
MDEVTRGMGLALPHCTVQQCRALELDRVRLRNQVGLVGWLVQLPLCMCFFVFFCFLNFFNQHCKRLIYTSCGTGIFIFKAVLGRDFSL